MPDTNNISLRSYRKNFNNLQAILYRDFYINGCCFRILGITLIDLPFDWGIKKHSHSFFEANYVAEGVSCTTINGIEYHVEPGHFFILPPGIFHSHKQGAHVGFGIRWEITEDKSSGCIIYNNDMVRVNNILLNAPLSPVKDEEGLLLNTMVDLLNMAMGSAMVLELQLEFSQLIMGLCRFCTDKGRSIESEISQDYLDNKAMDAVIKFIEENYSQDIDVNDVSRSVHMSYSHLARLFKKHRGETINSFINNVRLRKAQYLLACTDKTMWEIASEVGFKSENYFFSIFKKQYDMSPRSYRISKKRLSE